MNPPMQAPIYDRFASGDAIPAEISPSRLIEPEIMFRIDNDLPARERNYSVAEIMESVTAVVGFEVIGSRFSTADAPDGTPRVDGTGSLYGSLSDHLANGCIVVGDEIRGWRDVEFEDVGMRMTEADRELISVVGCHPFDNPFLPVVVGVNRLRRDSGVRAGDIIVTNSSTSSDEELRRYSGQGYVAPIRVLAPHEVEIYRARVEQFINECGAAGSVTEILRTKVHLHCPALLELVHLPAIVEPVSDLLGPDLLCRSASVFLKEPGDPAYVAWHQDAAYFELDPPDVADPCGSRSATARSRTARSRSCPEAIASRFSRTGRTGDPANMLSRGQAITAPIDPEEVVTLHLHAGEMSIHDVRLADASAPNRSSARRLGFAIRYVAAHVRKTGPRR